MMYAAPKTLSSSSSSDYGAQQHYHVTVPMSPERELQTLHAFSTFPSMSQSTTAPYSSTASMYDMTNNLPMTPERIYSYRPAIPPTPEEASEHILDKLEQAGRVPSKEKFRRMACNTFIFTGACPYNDRCVFLHDYRIKTEGMKVRTTRQNKANSANKDTFYWPDMTRKDVLRNVDNQGLPSANQIYVIPEAFKTNPANFHNRGLYSLWAHFVEFCIHNNIFYSRKQRDLSTETFFQISGYKENPHIPGAKRLDVMIHLSLGKSARMEKRVAKVFDVDDPYLIFGKNGRSNTWSGHQLDTAISKFIETRDGNDIRVMGQNYQSKFSADLTTTDQDFDSCIQRAKRRISVPMIPMHGDIKVLEEFKALHRNEVEEDFSLKENLQSLTEDIYDVTSFVSSTEQPCIDKSNTLLEMNDYLLQDLVGHVGKSKFAKAEPEQGFTNTKLDPLTMNELELEPEIHDFAAVQFRNLNSSSSTTATVPWFEAEDDVMKDELTFGPWSPMETQTEVTFPFHFELQHDMKHEKKKAIENSVWNNWDESINENLSFSFQSANDIPLTCPMSSQQMDWLQTSNKNMFTI